MSLADTLSTVTGLRQLPEVAFELGFSPTWHELSLGSLKLPSTPEAPAAIVGRRAGLLLLAVHAAPAAQAAHRIARHLAARGQLMVVAVIDPVARHLALSASVADCPVATITLDRVRAVDQRILERGRTAPTDSTLGCCLAWSEALAGRSLDQRFFERFRTTLERAIDALPRRIPRADRHALALLDLTRVLFLYFVQERGWLDGRSRFLREELDRCLAAGGRVERRFLKPLFFGTLNRPSNRRSAVARRFGAVPFLNGGLFDPHPLEHAWPDDLPDAVWQEAFDELFERHHFTISGETDARASIGPDMLGRVFEGVMDPELRRATGAFYTPSDLVDEVVTASLSTWIAGAAHCTRSEVPALLESPTAALLERVREVAILDPAVGSGAFLLGALRQLVAIRVRGGECRGAATRAVVAHNLFGVDVNPNAVRLTELRLWLEVIEADPGTTADAIAPLPNLDALIRQGDSIFERVDLPFAVSAVDAGAMAVLRRTVVSSTGPAKRRALASLRQAEIRAARSALEAAVATAESAIRDLAAAGRSPGLFGERVPLNRTHRAELDRIRRHRTLLRQLLRRLRTNDELPWFHYGSQFAEIATGGGFDLVLGNPPWVRAEALSQSEREALKRRYRWFRSGGRVGRPSGFAPLPDLSVAFAERAFELVRPGGVVGLLLPAKLLTAQYAAVAREGLARGVTLAVVANLQDHGKAFDATVYPMALIGTRAGPPSGHRLSTQLGSARAQVLQHSLGGSSPWTFDPAATAPASRTDTPRLGDHFRIRLGVKTGADEVFVDPPAPIEEGLLRPAVRGRDVGPFQFVPVRQVIWAIDRRGRPVEEVPPLASRYFVTHERRLKHRADYQAGPPWTVFRTDAGLRKYRVIWADLARRLGAVALIGSADRLVIPLNTCYWIGTDSADESLALAAWLNSRIIGERAKRHATVAASGYSRFNAELVGNLPVAPNALTDRTLIALSRAAHQEPPGDQAAIDRRVIDLLEHG